jgi:hypothetical protein
LKELHRNESPASWPCCGNVNPHGALTRNRFGVEEPKFPGTAMIANCISVSTVAAPQAAGGMVATKTGLKFTKIV